MSTCYYLICKTCKKSIRAARNHKIEETEELGEFITEHVFCDLTIEDEDTHYSSSSILNKIFANDRNTKKPL